MSIDRRSSHGRDRKNLALLIALIVVALLIGGGVYWAATSGTSDSSTASSGQEEAELDRSDPEAVVGEYSTRFVAEDPTVCELATSEWRIKLDNAGKCAGHVNPSDPKPSATVRSLDADADPAHAVVQAGPQKYGPGDACIDIDLVEDGDGWSVSRSEAPLFNDDGAPCGE